jgi:hypothetical protein
MVKPLFIDELLATRVLNLIFQEKRTKKKRGEGYSEHQRESVKKILRISDLREIK